MSNPIYDPSVFSVKSAEEAKRVILTTPASVDHAAYWERCTAATGDILVRELVIGPDSVVLDFGCGIGRLAKHLIERTGCRVLGVDISAEMRQLAVDYVQSDRFTPISSEAFASDPALTGRCAAAYAALSLQHCFDPAAELRNMARLCVPGAPVLIENARTRFVPTNVGWRNDGKDVDALARAVMTFVHDVPMDDPRFWHHADAPTTDSEKEHYCKLFRNDGPTPA